jgi:hypothetical protein
VQREAAGPSFHWSQGKEKPPLFVKPTLSWTWFVEIFSQLLDPSSSVWKKLIDEQIQSQ